MNAFDFKVLGERLMEIGLPVAEKTAEEAYAVVKMWLVESAELKGGLIGAVLPVAINAVDGYVVEKIDMIDGEAG